jgi:hypothetical protein
VPLTPFRHLSFSNNATITHGYNEVINTTDSATANAKVVIDSPILTKLGTECYQRALDALEHSY